MMSIGSWSSAVLVLVSACAGLYGYIKVPHDKMVAIHFNTSGVADGYAPASVAFLVIPLVGMAIFGLTAWQAAPEPGGRISWANTSLILLAVQAALCFGQFFILHRALRG